MYYFKYFSLCTSIIIFLLLYFTTTKKLIVLRYYFKYVFSKRRVNLCYDDNVDTFLIILQYRPNTITRIYKVIAFPLVVVEKNNKIYINI